MLRTGGWLNGCLRQQYVDAEGMETATCSGCPPEEKRTPYKLLVVKKGAKSKLVLYHAPQADDTAYFLSVYGLLGAGNSALALARSFLFAYGGVCAARTLHDMLLARLLGGTVGFFDATPVCICLLRLMHDHSPTKLLTSGLNLSTSGLNPAISDGSAT